MICGVISRSPDGKTEYNKEFKKQTPTSGLTFIGIDQLEHELEQLEQVTEGDKIVIEGRYSLAVMNLNKRQINLVDNLLQLSDTYDRFIDKAWQYKYAGDYSVFCTTLFRRSINQIDMIAQSLDNVCYTNDDFDRVSIIYDIFNHNKFGRVRRYNVYPFDPEGVDYIVDDIISIINQ